MLVHVEDDKPLPSGTVYQNGYNRHKMIVVGMTYFNTEAYYLVMNLDDKGEPFGEPTEVCLGSVEVCNA